MKLTAVFWQDFSQLDINLDKPIKNREHKIESQSPQGFWGECTPRVIHHMVFRKNVLKSQSSHGFWGECTQESAIIWLLGRMHPKPSWVCEETENRVILDIDDGSEMVITNYLCILHKFNTFNAFVNVYFRLGRKCLHLKYYSISHKFFGLNMY